MQKHILLAGRENVMKPIHAAISAEHKRDVHVRMYENARRLIEGLKEIEAAGGEVAVKVFDMASLSGEEIRLIGNFKHTHPCTQIVKLISGHHGNRRKEDDATFHFPISGGASAISHLLKKMLREYDSRRGLKIRIGGHHNIIIRQAKTIHELKLWFTLRYKVYVRQECFIRKDKLTEAQHSMQMEWDEYDFPGAGETFHSMKDFNPANTTIVIIKNGQCIGGVRILDGDIPISNCYKKFGDFAEKNSVYPREVSRLILDKKNRGNKAVLLGLLRYIYQVSHRMSGARKDLLCTSQRETIPLYERMGFYVVEDKPLSDYPLNGDWFFMHLDMDSTYRGTYRSSRTNRYFVNLISQDLAGIKSIYSPLGKLYEVWNGLRFRMTRRIQKDV
jgi:predicted GNAT family N-acyltransferase